MSKKDKDETATQSGIKKIVITFLDKLGQFISECYKVAIVSIIILAIVAGLVLFIELERMEESQRRWDDFSLAKKVGDGMITDLSSDGKSFSGGTTGTIFEMKTKEPLKGFPNLRYVIVGDSGSFKVSMIDVNANQYYRSAFFSPVPIKQEKTLYMATYERGHMYASSWALVGGNDIILDDSKDPYREKRVFDIYIELRVPPNGNVSLNNLIVESRY